MRDCGVSWNTAPIPPTPGSIWPKGLEFKLGSEILRTVVVREFNEIFIVAGIIALRAVLTLLIHWEIKNESGGTAGEPSEKSKK